MQIKHILKRIQQKPIGNGRSVKCYWCNLVSSNLSNHQRLLHVKYDNIRSNISHNPACNKAWSKAEATAKAC